MSCLATVNILGDGFWGMDPEKWAVLIRCHAMEQDSSRHFKHPRREDFPRWAVQSLRYSKS